MTIRDFKIAMLLISTGISIGAAVSLHKPFFLFPAVFWLIVAVIAWKWE